MSDVFTALAVVGAKAPYYFLYTQHSPLKPRANGRINISQQLPTLLDVTCCFHLHALLHVVARCWELLTRV